MTTPARIAHLTRGRIRIEIPGRRGDKAFFAKLADQVSHAGSVMRVRGNEAAASLVIEYTGQLDEVIRELQRSELDIARLPAKRDADMATTTMATTTATSVRVPRDRGWQVTPMFVAGTVFGLVGIVQTLRGEIMIPALSAFWYAAGALHLMHIRSPGSGTASAVDPANSILP